MGSRFRYSGRTEFQVSQHSRARRTVQFERRPSQRYSRRPQLHHGDEIQRSSVVVSETIEPNSDNSSFAPSPSVAKTTDTSASSLGNQSDNINELIKTIAKDSSFMNEKEECPEEQSETTKNRESTLSESEVLACKLKALDSSPSKLRKGLLPKAGGPSSSIKDVNILPNNQILPSCGGAKPIPLDQMKCNILKSRVNQENSKNSDKGAVDIEEDNQYTNIIEKIHQSAILTSCDDSKDSCCDTCNKTKLTYAVDNTDTEKSHPVGTTKSIVIEENISPWHVLSSPKDKYILLTTEV